MILVIVTLIFVLLCFIFRVLKQRKDVYVCDDLILFHLIYLSSFLWFFLYFLRFFNRNYAKLDLKIFLDKISLYNILFIVILFLIAFILRNIIFFYTKLIFLKTHYYFFFFFRKSFYSKIFYFLCYSCKKIDNFFILNTNSLKKSYYIMKYLYFFFRYGFTIMVFILFLYEIIYNNFVLEKIFIIIPYYAIYQLIVLFIIFLNTKLDLLFDIEMSNYIYTTNIKYQEDFLMNMPNHLNQYLNYILT